jgi:FAD/FMN-containing dehydrogenase
MSAVSSAAYLSDAPAIDAAPKTRATALSGWGRHPRSDCALIEARSAEDVVAAIAKSATLIARGNGRSYGDPALNPAGTLSLLKSNRFVDFDPASGMLTCEAGVLLKDVIDVFLPRGWFPAGYAGHEIRDRRRHDRQQRPRQEPSSVRQLRRSRREHRHGARRWPHCPLLAQRE